MLHSWPRAILHLDGDAFFASCEQAMHPEYQGRAVITGKERGIVAAASYEAKAKGINRGVPLWEVKKLCPEAIIVPSDYETYSLFSKRMFAIMRRFTPQVEEYSIDEGFADITGLQRPLNLSYKEIAQKMKLMVERELGITVSIGLSISKVLAKIGSKYQKPSGLTIISGRHIEQYLVNTGVEKIWGIGAKTAAYCQKLGLNTALHFAQKNEWFIKSRFSKPYQEIWHELNGRSVYPVVTQEKTTYATIGKTKTFSPPSSDQSFIFAQLLKNMENACIKARRHHLVARGLIIYLRKNDYRTVAAEGIASRATAYPSDLTEILNNIFKQIVQPNAVYRATGIVLINLMPDDKIQTSLFERPAVIEKMNKIYEAVDELAAKFGKHTVYLAAGASAHKTPQHIWSRGDLTARKLNRLKGETARQHLAIPVFPKEVH